MCDALCATGSSLDKRLDGCLGDVLAGRSAIIFDNGGAAMIDDNAVEGSFA